MHCVTPALDETAECIIKRNMVNYTVWRAVMASLFNLWIWQSCLTLIWGKESALFFAFHYSWAPLSPLLLHMVYNHCHQVVILVFTATSEPEQRWDFSFSLNELFAAIYLLSLLILGYCFIMNCKGQSRYLFSWQINIHERYNKETTCFFQNEKSFPAFRKPCYEEFLQWVFIMYCMPLYSAFETHN